MSEKMQNRVEEALGLLLLLLAGYMIISMLSYDLNDPSFTTASDTSIVHNWGGPVGAYLADGLILFFGLVAFIFPLMIGALAVQFIRHAPPPGLVLRAATIPLLLLAFTAVFTIIQPMADWPTADSIGNGGLVGKMVALGLSRWIGVIATLALCFVFAVLSSLWLSGLSLGDLWTFARRVHKWSWKLSKYTYRLAKRLVFKRATQNDLPLPLAKPKKVRRLKPMVEKKAEKKASSKQQQTTLPLALEGSYQLPDLSLLNEIKANDKPQSEDDLTQNARRIEAELQNFGVEGQVTKVRPGPVITIYELEPAAGVKTAAVVNLAEDLARAMSATAIRIAPIPGRPVIGIEMPNQKRQGVGLRTLLEAEDFEHDDGDLTIALGVDTGGSPVYADIGKMPHALIAGTTGSGKSVAMNAFILSLLYRMGPDQLKFVMIDPKMLELSIYNDIPHLLTPVITDPNKAAGALKWVVGEMEHRYKIMSELGVKNIAGFNVKFNEMKAKGETPKRIVQTGFEPTTGRPIMEEQPMAAGPLPYIVVVIDELSDLMMVAGKQVEVYIARLAQMARASGIHLLVATQRPSVDVVTGLIKANIPTRISFSVMSKIDSRTVLDSMGAESLLGKGDMLAMINGTNRLQRCHGAFVSEEECARVADFYKKQGEPHYVDMNKASVSAAVAAGTGANGGNVSEGGDDLYNQAIELVAREQKASTSFIQRGLKIGYNRAADLIDRMEKDGLVSAADHVGKREVIVRQPPADVF